MIAEILSEALLDALKILPFLLAIYIVIELFEYKFGGKITKLVRKAGNAGPLLGAIAGAFPQCGFSIMATALYTQRLATIGTLLAVYISTSDEAFPILLADPGGIKYLFPLIGIKILIAAIAGFTIDLVFKKSNLAVLTHIDSFKNGTDAPEHNHGAVADEPACCGHIADSASRKFEPREILLHPILHTVKIFVFIFAISAAVGLVMEFMGRAAIGEWFANATTLQPVIAVLIGLIPNCAASVAITEFYLQGLITYGAALAGLCASAGLGLLVLVREEKNAKNIALIFGLLFGISVSVGYVAQLAG